jgi:DNA-binding transcriptional LysR family regulator
MPLDRSKRSQAWARATLSLARVAQAENTELRGPVRLTVPEFIASELLMPDLVAFCRRWPQVELFVDGSYRFSNLDQREADVAIRVHPHGVKPQEHQTGRLAATLYGAAYGEGDAWVGQIGGAPDRHWVAASAFPDLPVRGAMYGTALQKSACKAGLGMVERPCFFADADMPRRSAPRPGYDIWVLVHPDLRRNPRLKVFRDALVAALQRHRARLEGRED